jgi:hypothetical protein
LYLINFFLSFLSFEKKSASAKLSYQLTEGVKGCELARDGKNPVIDRISERGAEVVTNASSTARLVHADER